MREIQCQWLYLKYWKQTWTIGDTTEQSAPTIRPLASEGFENDNELSYNDCSCAAARLAVLGRIFWVALPLLK